jgi:hypothetical protein
MSTRTNGRGPAVIVTRPASGSYHPARMNYLGARQGRAQAELLPVKAASD